MVNFEYNQQTYSPEESLTSRDLITSNPLPFPLSQRRGELLYLLRFTPHPNLPPKGRERNFFT